MIKSLLFWLAFPFVIPQAIRVKKKAPRFADAKGDFEGAIGSGERLKFLAIGDSIIAGVGTSHISLSWMGQTVKYLSDTLASEVHWQRIAESGAKLQKINQSIFIKSIEPNVDVILISVGVNDVTGLTSLSQWQNQLHIMLKTLKQHSPESIIAISGIPPMHLFPLLPQPLRYVLGLRARTLDELIQLSIKKYEKVIHIPIEIDLDPKNFSEDGYHPSKIGCQKWAELTASMIVAELR
jgi:lysophospholipase L1-like esterase